MLETLLSAKDSPKGYGLAFLGLTEGLGAIKAAWQCGGELVTAKADCGGWLSLR